MKCQDIFFILAKNSGKIVKKIDKISKKEKTLYINFLKYFRKIS